MNENNIMNLTKEDIENNFKRIERKLLSSYSPSSKYVNLGRKPKVVNNPYRDYFSIAHLGSYYEKQPEGYIQAIIDLEHDEQDVLYGACMIDYGKTKHLSEMKLLCILSCLDKITTRGIQSILHVSESTARNYLYSSKIVIDYMTRKINPL